MILIKINLQVFSEFEFESQTDCAYDYLQVFNGPNNSANSLGKFCGTRKPSPLISTGHQIFLKFVSDASVQKRGFSASHTTGERGFYN